MERYASAVKLIGPERCILSSCGGQAWMPVHTFAWSELIAGMRRNGISEADIGRMTRTNPARLLGLD
jgi:predicted metal-dependent phosphotriesterase family hydrolase